MFFAATDGSFGIRTRALLIFVNFGLGEGDGLAREAIVAEVALTVDWIAGLTQMVQVTKVTMTSENIVFIVILLGVESEDQDS